MNKCCLYYTAHRHDPAIEMACRKQLDLARGDIPLVAVGLQPFDYGDVTIVLPLEPGPLTLHKQILAGLEQCEAHTVFFTENDVLYHPSHFEFEPRDNQFWYNTNVIKARYPDGHLVWTDDLQQTSGLCADRNLLLEHYRRRVKEIEGKGFDRHYEPGRKTGPYGTHNWLSRYPNLDIRHDKTITKSKWSPDEFRNPKYAKGWREFSVAPGWGIIEGRFMELLNGIINLGGGQ